MSTFNHLGSIHLGDQTKNIFQNVYSSQSYETFFGISAEFDYDKNTKKIKDINLSLQNYKGILNICFAERPTITKEILNSGEYQEVQIREYFSIKFKVRYAHDAQPKYDYSVDMSAIINDTVANGQLITLERELVSFYDKSAKELHDMEKKSKGSTKTMMFLNGVFDSEFFYRNGELWKLREDGDFSVGDVQLAGAVDDTKTCKQRISQLIIA